MKLPSKIKGWLGVKLSSEELIQHYQKSGDRKCMTRVIERYNDALYHYLVSQSNQDLAQDLLQLTWEKFLKSMNNTFTNSSVKNCLYCIARNNLIDEYRRQNRWQFLSLEEDLLPLGEGQSLDNVSTPLAKFNECINRLPFHQKDAFILQQDGFSIREIAEITQENQETIKSRLRYARQFLKTQLSATL